MKEIELYTDGACSGNPGPGGWGCVLCYGEIKKELSGFEAHTTNNRMELTAAIEGLHALNQPCSVKLYSDSSYLINAFSLGWVYNWEKKNWLRKPNDEVPNKELWIELLRLSRTHRIEWIKVKGHADNELNNRCDRLAVGQIKENSTKIRS
ncbi:MAG: ribonuclease HI [Clostridiales bacterium]|nr:ribonuclease HI [Clostridiales bacterium]MBQ2817315.1 ribonuclease HI [Clostridia bacterium]MBQ4637097.1 ribonuclease HI [Clostridia bacterium]